MGIYALAHTMQPLQDLSAGYVTSRCIMLKVKSEPEGASAIDSQSKQSSVAHSYADFTVLMSN